jgi:sporulation protein YlmC with PRC-barrel domain
MERHDSTETQAHGTEWRASQLLRRPVVHVQRVQHAGEVVDVAFDPERRAIAGILIGPAALEPGVGRALRRALGAPFGVTYIPADQIHSLNGDVVMISTHDQGPHLRRPHAPMVVSTQGFMVVSTSGRFLGRFADLVLDADGRRITGYLISPNRAGIRPPREAAPVTGAGDAAEGDGQAADTAGADPQLLMIPASYRVRVGRDLVVVGDTADEPAHWPTPPAPEPHSRGPVESWPDLSEQPTEQMPS